MLIILGGKWKNTKLNFNIPNIKPTTMVLKKNLFNWLNNNIINKNILDLFCGSGSLGFEALSRGCQSLTLVDKNKLIFNYLKNLKKKLFNNNIFIYNMSVYKYILKFKFKFKLYDIVFLDPPYININILFIYIKNIIVLLKKNSLIYIESIFNYKLILNRFSNLNLVKFFVFKKINASLFLVN